MDKSYSHYFEVMIPRKPCKWLKPGDLQCITDLISTPGEWTSTEYWSTFLALEDLVVQLFAPQNQQ
jgi:hypothetical protein